MGEAGDFAHFGGHLTPPTVCTDLPVARLARDGATEDSEPLVDAHVHAIHKRFEEGHAAAVCRPAQHVEEILLVNQWQRADEARVLRNARRRRHIDQPIRKLHASMAQRRHRISVDGRMFNQGPILLDRRRRFREQHERLEAASLGDDFLRGLFPGNR